MYVIGYFLCFVVLTLMKGFMERRQIGTSNYSKRNFALFAVAWLAWTLPGVSAGCNEIACRYSVQVGWVLYELAKVVPMMHVNPPAMVIVAMVGYMLLSVYFLGHCLGWLLYGVTSLLRPLARPRGN